jgi:hypothetical protein
MTEEFPDKLWTLVKLRYRLIWAQARTRNGKIALLVLLYLLGGSVALLLALGGLGAAIADEEFRQEGFLARWMLAGFFVNGMGLSLLFGIGARAAFTDESLRRYPLDDRERFAIRQVIGLLDPVWTILVLGVLGMAAGFAWLGKGLLITGIPAALLFIVANYLATVILLSVIGLMVQTRRGAAILSVIVLLLISFGPLAFSLAAFSGGRALWEQLDKVLIYSPAGGAAAMMVAESAFNVIGNFFLLIAWCAGLALLVKKLESLPPISEVSSAGKIIWDDFHDQAAGLFGRAYAPLVSKALRYHLRCNLIRFSLITSPLLVVLGRFMIPGQSASGTLIITFALFFITSSATGAAMMLNLFGYDDAGIRRYAFMPSTFAMALRAGSFASLILRAVTMLLAFAIWIIVARNQINLRMLLMVFGIVVASLFLFNALGLWTSVLAAKRADFESMWNNRLSFGANIVMIGGVVIPYVIAIVLAEQIPVETALRFWWVSFLLMMACIAFYAFSLRAIESALESRRETLINLMAGAKDS